MTSENIPPSESPNGNGTPNPPKVTVQERIDEAIRETARRLEQTAEQFDRLGVEGTRASDYSHQVAHQLRNGARYLESARVDSLLEQARESVRRNPVASLGVAFGVGFLLAQLLRRR